MHYKIRQIFSQVTIHRSAYHRFWQARVAATGEILSQIDLPRCSLGGEVWYVRASGIRGMQIAALLHAGQVPIDFFPSVR